MNLTKLFNKNYLMQNLKKSKTGLLITTLIVPILTVLIMINSYSDFNDSIFVSNIINLIGMFIIPIVISKILFGYVFKRKSVDFIGSMPINRKTIYITNLIGGILIIFLIQLLTFTSVGITSLFLDYIIINMNMLIDFFIVGLISYTFVFVATNIGMAISGNLITQIAITMLILFLIPFTMDAMQEFRFYEHVEFEMQEGENINVDIENIKNYTMPYNSIKNVFMNNSQIFNKTSIIKMLILIVIYSEIGMILFQKRKMENTEEAFSNVYVHLVVKGLTLVPIVAIATMTHAPFKIILLILTIMFIYYYIYDIITKRKVKFKTQILGFIITTVLLFGIFNLGGIINNNEEEKYNKEDIKSIGISQSYGTYGKYIRKQELNYQFQNKELIDEFYNGIEMNPYTEFDNYTNLYAKIKLKNGKEIESRFYIKSDSYNKIINMINVDKNYVENKKKSLEIKNNDNYVIILNNEKIHGDDKEKIIELINKTVDKNIIKIKNNEIDYSSKGEIYCYFYKNHELYNIRIPLYIDKELERYSINLINKMSKEKIKKIDMEDKDLRVSYRIRELDKEHLYNNFTTKEKELIKFIDNENELVDINKKMYTIELTIDTSKRMDRLYYYTNNIEEINKIIKYDKNMIDIPKTIEVK